MEPFTSMLSCSTKTTPCCYNRPVPLSSPCTMTMMMNADVLALATVCIDQPRSTPELLNTSPLLHVKQEAELHCLLEPTLSQGHTLLLHDHTEITRCYCCHWNELGRASQ